MFAGSCCNKQTGGISLKVHTENELEAVRELGQGIGDLGACLINGSLPVRYMGLQLGCVWVNNLVQLLGSLWVDYLAWLK